MLFDLESDAFQFFRHPYGFAIAFKGRPTEVELMFLYVRKSAEGQGIGVQLGDGVKHMAGERLVTLQCEGYSRMAYFEGRKFRVTMQLSKDRFRMQWPPAAAAIESYRRKQHGGE